MKLALLDAKNPEYDVDVWRRYDALYRGGRAFRQALEWFLPQNEMEPYSVYEKRRREAHYRSYVGPIVDYFAAQLFTAPIVVRAKIDGGTVDPPAFYAGLKENCDGLGLDFVDFARARMIEALVKGASWWVVELPTHNGVPPANRAEWESRQLGQAKLRSLETEAVVDWEVDGDGHLLWAIVTSCDTPRPDPRASRGIVRRVWKIYDRANVETFEVTYDPNADHLTPERDIASLGQEPHGFTSVPLVRMAMPNGLWLVDRVADAQVEHFRLSSGLGWGIRRTCYAVPVFQSSDPDRPPQTGGNFVTIGVGESFSFASPDSAPFALIAQAIKDQKDEIYRVAQQMALGVDNNAAAVGRSADSKVQDSNATEVCLTAYGAVVREAIERTYKLISQGREDDIEWSIEGLDKFNLANASIVIADALQVQTLGVPSETFRRELFAQVANATLPHIEQSRRDAIRREIEAGVAAESDMRAVIDDIATRDGLEPKSGLPPMASPA